MPRKIYPIPFVIHPSDELAKNIDLRNLSRNLATKYAEGYIVTDDDLQIMGCNLWNLLGMQDEFDAMQKEAGAAILSIIIESNAPDIQALPWETLYHPTHQFIGRNPAFTLTRRIEAEKETRANPDKGPLRVLLFTSLPDNVHPELGRLNVEHEQEQVQEALIEWISKGVVQLEMPDDGRFSTLRESLERFDPHVLFLSGHGKFHHEPHSYEAPYGEFLFESEIGEGEAIRDEEIARALVKTRVQAVILSACESGKAASDALSNGLMQRISAGGIPHVIGMRESILDVAGIQFARALCDEMAGRARIDTALQSARLAIHSSIDERGQWCLPMMLSTNPQTPIIDWDFQPQATQAQRLNQRISNVSLPAHFVGRRAERRNYQNRLIQGMLRSLLITGAGGQGKTALAGKLALDLQNHGWKLFAWGVSAEKSWSGFAADELFNALDGFRQDRYKETASKQPLELERAKLMLKELSEQFGGRVILFFDNLETLQDADTFEIKDETIAIWLQAAGSADGVTVLVTSRWVIPNWAGERFEGLAGVKYGDFLQIASTKNLPVKREQMSRLWKALGGNIRGLEFFTAAANDMDSDSEEAFLQTIEQTKSELQANMAIEEIFSRLPDEAKKLLVRLPSYQVPVPMEGLLKLGMDLPNAETLLERLMAVSLLEASYKPHWDVTEYQCAPMVVGWMRGKGLVDDGHEWLNLVADYHLDLFNNERKTLSQAITTHLALRRAERHHEADQLTLDYIVVPMTRAGFYIALITDWLGRICGSEDLKTRGRALNQIGKLYEAQGDYETALTYLKQSLVIKQQIGDKSGEIVALGDISKTYSGQGNYGTALMYLNQSQSIAEQIGDTHGKGIALGSIANIFLVQGDYETALSYMEQSQVVMKQIEDKAVEGVLLNNISQIYQRQGNYETALSYLKQSLAINQQIGDKANEWATLNNISQIFQEQGNYETALSYLKQSLSITQKIGDKPGESTTLNNIGNVFYVQGNAEMALSYQEQSLAIAQQIGDKNAEGRVLNNISRIFGAWREYEKSLTYLKQALSTGQLIGDKETEGTALGNIGNNYYEKGDYKSALFYLEQSLAIFRQIGNKLQEGVALNNISQIYSAQEDNETALIYLKQSLVISSQLGDKEGISAILFNIGKIYIKTKRAWDGAKALAESYLIAKQIGYAQVLQELNDLALQVGLRDGLDGWGLLAQKLETGEGRRKSE